MSGKGRRHRRGTDLDDGDYPSSSASSYASSSSPSYSSSSQYEAEYGQGWRARFNGLPLPAVAEQIDDDHPPKLRRAGRDSSVRLKGSTTDASVLSVPYQPIPALPVSILSSACMSGDSPSEATDSAVALAQTAAYSRGSNSRDGGFGPIPSSNPLFSLSRLLPGGRTSTDGVYRKDHPDVAEMEKLIVSELNKLTIGERERVYDELHGVAPPLKKESEEYLSDKLVELERDIQKLVAKHKKKAGKKTRRMEEPTSVSSQFSAGSSSEVKLPLVRHELEHEASAYELVSFLKPQMVRDRQFLIRFLRADEYDTDKAAQRVLGYFSAKYKLWGFDKLCHDITQDDMDPDDIDLLKSGSIVVNPDKLDRSGRTVFFWDLDGTFTTPTSLLRVVWYLLEMAVLREDVQRRGIVHVLYSVNASAQKASQILISSAQAGVKISKTIPFRLVSLHFCYSNRYLRYPMAVIQQNVGKDVRIRFRSHFGTDIEVHYALQAFGLLDDVLPIYAGYKKANLEHLKYVDRLRQDEAEKEVERRLQDGSVIDIPTQRDVLLGRGKLFAEYPGNLRLSSIVEKYREPYNAAEGNFQKTSINRLIVSIIHEHGGRFLERLNKEAPKNDSDSSEINGNDTHSASGWIEVSDEMAVKKVGRFYRK